MACGVPIICSNASSLPEIVGDAAIILNPNKVDAWANAIRTVLTNPMRRAEMRLRSMAQAKKFSWERTTEQTLSVYQKIARESH